MEYLAFLSMLAGQRPGIVISEAERIGEADGVPIYRCNGGWVRIKYEFERAFASRAEASRWGAAELDRVAGEVMADANSLRIAAAIESEVPA